MAQAALQRVARDYLEQTSLHGPRYLTQPCPERLVWLVVLAATVWGVVVVIVDVWLEFMRRPTVTTIDSTTFPIWRVPFPAVAVCSVNKMSLAASTRLAESLSEASGVSEAEALSLLRYAGRLYDYESSDLHNIDALHQLLGRSYNVTSVMLQVAPTCEDLLVRCSWQGRLHNCSQLFKTRKTMEGFCCAFNYVRGSDDFISPEDIQRYQRDREDDPGIKVDSPGYEMGLTVLVNDNYSDYFYPLISSSGTKVLVFNPRDYPDTPSGSLTEKLVPPGSEVFLRLGATSTWSTESVRGYSQQRRCCLFQSELADLFAGYYSYSDCLMNCRISSIAALCDCVPFYFPSRGNTRECNVLDIQCLSKYREKWLTLRPTDDIAGLEAEREDSISCVECRPACTDTAYSLQSTFSPIMAHHDHGSQFLEGIELKNHSVFHLFFGSSDSVRLKHDTLYYWYDLMSNFGGLCGLFVGFSLISIVEFFYFFTIRLFYIIQEENSKRSAQNGNQTYDRNMLSRNYSLAGQDVRKQLYWREMVPSNVQIY